MDEFIRHDDVGYELSEDWRLGGIRSAIKILPHITLMSLTIFFCFVSGAFRVNSQGVFSTTPSQITLKGKSILP